MEPLPPEQLGDAKLRQLARLAEAANSAHCRARHSASEAFASAFLAGNALARARDLCDHGEWIAWLRRNFRGAPRTAQRYIRLVQCWRGLRANATGVSHLRRAHRSLRDALLGEIPGAPRARESRSNAGHAQLADGRAIVERAVEGLGALAARLSAGLAGDDALGAYAVRRIVELRDELRFDAAQQREGAGPRPLVYFIEAVGAGRIKIGHARDPQSRLRELQTGSGHKLRLLATAPGGVALEQILHRRFQDLRLVGEWFRAAPQLLAEIEALGPRDSRPTSPAFGPACGE